MLSESAWPVVCCQPARRGCGGRAFPFAAATFCAALRRALTDRDSGWRLGVLVSFTISARAADHHAKSAPMQRTALRLTRLPHSLSLQTATSPQRRSYRIGFGSSWVTRVLLWVYYSAQIFLFGAEFTKVYAHHHGSRTRRATPTGVS